MGAGTKPRELTHNDLVLSHFSLAPAHPIEDRVRLAAEHGFAGIGLYVGQYAQLERDGFAPHGLRELLAEHGICLAEIEVIPGLGADGPGGERAAEMEVTAWRMADEFESRYLQVIGPSGDDAAMAGAAFGALCDRAGDHGLVVGLEFLPFTDVVSVHDARRIVEAADRPNGGVCVDIWHVERGVRDLDAIASLPGGRITGIQLSDGPHAPVNGDYYTDCLENRLPPGAGAFDIAALLEAVRSTGCAVPLSLEVCSKAGWADAARHVGACAAGIRNIIAPSGPRR
ncbi:MAG: sugar phosphate isomerase/epimerase [Ilumatobacteraceae bacterium]